MISFVLLINPGFFFFVWWMQWSFVVKLNDGRCERKQRAATVAWYRIIGINIILMSAKYDANLSLTSGLSALYGAHMQSPYKYSQAVHYSQALHFNNTCAAYHNRGL